MLLPDVLMDKKNATNGLWINIKHIWKQVNLCKIKEVKCHIYLKTVFGRTKRLLKVYQVVEVQEAKEDKKGHEEMQCMQKNVWQSYGN